MCEKGGNKGNVEEMGRKTNGEKEDQVKDEERREEMCKCISKSLRERN